ncbi:hypothetical protein EIP86_004861 [Pleurotus ostreatoroseus]|nr:hypothetical protein EIP86_004861 [Pleurotus ostreatoroseus]
MIDFPLPILSVSTDVVKHLDGQDALYGMWTVFTKCKQSLKDGRRLENISWRLWYREMAAVHSSECHSAGSTSPASSDGRCPSPITPLSEDGPHPGEPPPPPASSASLRRAHPRPCRPADPARDSLMPTPDPLDRHSWHGDARPPPAAARRLSTASMPVRPRAHPAQSVGALILDILPATVVVPAPVPAKRPRAAPVPARAHPGTAKPSPVAQGTPSASASAHRRTPLAQPRPVVPVPVPTLSLPPATPPHPTQPGAPRVVVVNPTPHPTPPATPQLPTPGSALAAPARTHLVPPPVRSVVGGGAQGQGRAAIPSFERDGPAPTTTAPHPHPDKSPACALPLRSQAPSSGNTNTNTNTTQISGSASASARRGDDTLKPSDRRFFLQTSESPDQDSPERGPRVPSAGASAGYTTDSDDSEWASEENSVELAGARDTDKNKQREKASRTTSKENDKDRDHDREHARERERDATRLGAAAAEAQRQRDMFAKVDRRSYTSLAGPARARSGLLSQLLNPDPRIFPPDHPYRVKSLTDVSRLGMTGLSGGAGGGIATSKSSAALPLMTQVTPLTAQAPPADAPPREHHHRGHDHAHGNGNGNAHGNGNANTNANANANGNGQNGYRPKGRPQGQELEEDESGSEDEGENGIQLSRSLAQQRTGTGTSTCATPDTNARARRTRRPPQHRDRADPARAPVQPPRARAADDAAHDAAADARDGALGEPPAEPAVGAPGEQDERDWGGAAEWVE